MGQITLNEFIDIFSGSLDNKSFVKMTLSIYKGQESDLKNIYLKQILIKNESKLSFNYRYKTRDIVKNYSVKEGIEILQKFINVNLFLLTKNYQLSVLSNAKLTLKMDENVVNEPIDLGHDNEKKRIVNAKGEYLEKLKITDVNGIVYKTTQDKFKQINHYIELLSPLIAKMQPNGHLSVVDMGSGKGYLTFALYDYLKNNLHLATNTVGVEYRQDLVVLCNAIAKEVNFNGLEFVQGSIVEYQNNKIDILIALHACDTATDDAIFKGIKANASLIVVAPCCHKQIRKEIEKNKAVNNLDFLIKHGIFLERQAEMVTDGIRALILEYYGYSVNIQQFISDAHTPKNIMITAFKNQKREITEKRKLEIEAKIKSTKAYFGIKKHHLESLFE